ncbi:hypothetical protein F4808DRAFT_151767 [Astrocystis sublimbata]|nr:hypothetical protein F4808DRAFT_151767 [Astrocystis sublimbata]
MSYDPISYLGLSCKSGGEFYICQDSSLEFIGCCDVDPCSRGCASTDLHPASFNTEHYSEIQRQSCVGTLNALWYTCTDGPTFLGCCAANPCNNGGVCPGQNLVGARLGDDPSSASIFRTSSIATTVISGTSSTSQSTQEATYTPSFTSADESTPILSPTPTSNSTIPSDTTPSKESSPATNVAAIVGGILGALIVLLLIAFAFYRYRKRRRMELVKARPEDDDLQPPWSPYHDSFRSGTPAPPAPVSPISTTSTHQRSLSASLSSIIGFKRWNTPKRESFQATTEWISNRRNNEPASPGLLSPTELESLPTGAVMVRGPTRNTIHYEIEASMVRSGLEK